MSVATICRQAISIKTIPEVSGQGQCCRLGAKSGSVRSRSRIQ